MAARLKAAMNAMSVLKLFIERNTYTAKGRAGKKLHREQRVRVSLWRTAHACSVTRSYPCYIDKLGPQLGSLFNVGLQQQCRCNLPQHHSGHSWCLVQTWISLTLSERTQLVRSFRRCTSEFKCMERYCNLGVLHA